MALKAGDGTARIVKLTEEKEGLKVVWEFADSVRLSRILEVLAWLLTWMESRPGRL